MTIEWDFILKIFIAGVLGGIIGFEREIRAKGAGVRTHFIVSLGSALFMIISQYAFTGQFDHSRVAAQVVSGIGFIGAGVIIFQKNAVRGVTTAAGLWVAAAIGLAAGAGMYSVAAAAMLLTVICLEMMHFLNIRYGEKIMDLTLTSDGEEDFHAVLKQLKETRVNVESCSISDKKIHLTLRMRQKDYEGVLNQLVSKLEGFKVENLY